MKKPNIIKIAESAGVSTATVSRVFNNSDKTSEKVRNKVIKAAKKLGYTPKVKLGESNLALLVEGVDGVRLGNHATQLINRIGSEVISRGLNLEIIPVANIKSLKEKFFKTAIAIIHSAAAKNAIENAKLDIPVIMLNNQIDGFSSVCSDHQQGVEMAVDHLLQTGHKRIALFSFGANSWGTKERLNAYQKKINELKLPEGLLAISDGKDYMEVLANMLRYDPDSLIIIGEGSAMKVCHALRAFGKNIPNDLSVISYETDNVSEFMEPPHTTIYQNFDKLATQATDLAVKILQNEISKKNIRNIVLDNSLIIRHSVKNRS